MKTIHRIAVGSVAGGVSLLAWAGGASAWGNGCLDYTSFPTEAAYNAYLKDHPNAIVGACPTTTTAAPTTTTEPDETTTTTEPEVTTTTEPEAVTTTTAVAVVVTETPPTEPAAVVAPAVEAAAAPVAVVVKPAAKPAAKASTALPATGPSPQTPAIIAAAFGAVALGTGGVVIARRRGRTG